MIKVLVNGRYVTFEVDTGASVTCISRETFDRIGFTGTNLVRSDIPLKVANGSRIDKIERTEVTVRYKDITHKLRLYVVDSTFPTLFGREWIEAFFGSDWLSRLKDILKRIKYETMSRFDRS